MLQGAEIRLICCHAEGEVGDVIVSGVAPPPGDTLWEQSRFLASDQTLRNFVLNEPRGGVFRHVNLIVPAKDPRAAFGFIIMEPADTPPMSGSNSICVATVALESGLVPMEEPETSLVMEAPGGLVTARAHCERGKVRSISIENRASFADCLDASLEVDGMPTMRVDTAYGGDSFVIVDAAALGVALSPDEARELASLGVKIADAASEQLGFAHPELPDWRAHIILFVRNAHRNSRGRWAYATRCGHSTRKNRPISHGYRRQRAARCRTCARTFSPRRSTDRSIDHRLNI